MTKNFLIGVATAAHQIEGNNEYNDWWKYEKDLTGGVVSGAACNSWEMYEEDIKALKFLNANAYRFSIEWSRIEPEQGKFNQAALNQYLKQIKRLKEENIEPIVTLHHFSNPLWFEDSGGWLMKDSADIFLKYCEFIIPQLNDVKYFITINEPNVYVGAKYETGTWFPYKKDIRLSYFAYRNLINAHKKTYKLIKQKNPSSMVSLCLQFLYIRPKKKWLYPLNWLINKLVEYLSNYYVYDQTKNQLDFIGVNFYTRGYLAFNPLKFKLVTEPDMDDPHFMLQYIQKAKDIRKVVKIFNKKYKKPVMITENGMPTENDKKRSKYIEDVFKTLNRIKDEELDLIGYLHWTLVDNFEWAFGYSEKFGLFDIDFKTCKRTPKKSAYKFAELTKEFNSNL